MKKTLTVLSILSLIFVVIWQIFFSSTNYYLVSAVILVLSMLPFFISFERSAPTARELTLLAGLIALAVVSRAVFYLVPQVKPIAAVVGVSGVCLGAKRGYLVGAFSMFISNFIFGQGIWTPFQMVAMGFVGFLFGVIFERVKINRISLAVTGFLTVFVVYGFIVDLSSVLVLSADLSIKSVLTVYASGALFNLVFAFVTAVFLFAFCKLQRGNVKSIYIY